MAARVVWSMEPVAVPPHILVIRELSELVPEVGLGDNDQRLVQVISVVIYRFSAAAADPLHNPCMNQLHGCSVVDMEVQWEANAILCEQPPGSMV